MSKGPAMSDKVLKETLDLGGGFRFECRHLYEHDYDHGAGGLPIWKRKFRLYALVKDGNDRAIDLTEKDMDVLATWLAHRSDGLQSALMNTVQHSVQQAVAGAIDAARLVLPEGGGRDEG